MISQEGGQRLKATSIDNAYIKTGRSSVDKYFNHQAAVDRDMSRLILKDNEKHSMHKRNRQYLRRIDLWAVVLRFHN